MMRHIHISSPHITTTKHVMQKELVALPSDIPGFLEPYQPSLLEGTRPFVTLTYAQSLDSRIAAQKGERTTISHQETKTVTHYLRSLHDGILVGAGTVLADDPTLNCRFKEEQEEGIRSTPRPIVLDPAFKWDYRGSKLENAVLRGEGKEPWVVVYEGCAQFEKMGYLVKNGGRVLMMKKQKFELTEVLKLLREFGIYSVMVEGGARVIHEFLELGLVDSLVITIGPIYLGEAGVEVSPAKAVELYDVDWWRGTQDSILAAKVRSEH